MNRIECCFINRLNGCDELFKSLEKQPDIQVTTLNCIGNCLICAERFHCIVNGVRVVATSEEELRQLIVVNLQKK
ncbi:DUF1450 domain-containing protein [Anaerobacillus alkaliphilus]|uniref:DUF1450 domain-containing protein n=1 Tax=Anaerobacillus alkaliphilus TaxID=1548597 RepID=A0A4Q0VV19_9BACI|nr:DUF1450 domain-containing protein [Anaerobacillus alkaliphilus]